jgi:hypothetical protein
VVKPLARSQVVKVIDPRGRDVLKVDRLGPMARVGPTVVFVLRRALRRR